MDLGGQLMDNLAIDKVIIPVSACVPGMTLMQAIVDTKKGTTIVGKGQVLTEKSIEKLKNFEHTQIWVSTQSEASVWQLNSETLENHRRYSTILKTILEDVENRQVLAINELIELADTIVVEFKEEYQLLACVNLLNQLEKDTYEKSINVTFLALLMGKWKGYNANKLKDLVLAALLHDVGETLLPSYALNKREEDMNFIEKLEYRRHPIYSYEKLVSYNEISVRALKGVLGHHERCDGSGYPLSMKENKINDIAKIIGLADTYNDLKKHHHIFDVVRELGHTMMRKFEVNLLFEFCNNIMNYYVGCSVLLNTGEIGEVVFIQPQAWGRPIINVNGTLVNLHEKIHLGIVKVL